jgi:SAM-dependent methyltransferase
MTERPGMLHRPAGLAAAFDRAAQTYDARPGYPDDVYTLLTDHCGLRPGVRVLEIGPGAGQATLRLVEAGAQIVAVEPGPALAEVLRRRVADDSVTVLVRPFEQVDLPDASFDLVVAATAFHWIDPDLGVAQAGGLLRDGGWLALWWSIWGDDQRPDPFHEALVPVLRSKAPQLTADTMSASAFVADIDARMAAIERSGLFGVARRELLRWEGSHDPVGLRRMFGTFAAWITLADDVREDLLNDVEELARDRFGGVVRRPYQTVVYLAQRLPR